MNTEIQNSRSKVRFWRLLTFPLAASAYVVLLGFMTWRAGVPGFWHEYITWSGSKWFYAYSALYFAGALLLFTSIHVRSRSSFSNFRLVLALAAAAAIAFGALAIFAVLYDFTFKLRAG